MSEATLDMRHLRRSADVCRGRVGPRCRRGLNLNWITAPGTEANRSAEIIARTFRLIAPKHDGFFTLFSGNTEAWARYATAKKSQSA